MGEIFLKRLIIRSAAALLSAACLLPAIISFPVCAQKNSGDTALSGAGNAEQFGYTAYLAENSGYSAAAEEIKAEYSGGAPVGRSEIQVNVPSDGLYTFGMSYKANDDKISELEIALEIDGAFPFEQAEKLSFHRHFKDRDGKRVDGLGNEFNAEQIPVDEFYTEFAYDVTKQTYEPYLFRFSAGVHSLTISCEQGFELNCIVLGVPETVSEYSAPSDTSKLYRGEDIIIEGESAVEKNSYWLVPKYDNASVAVSPQSVRTSTLNYIGGSNWKTAGETIYWKTPELEAGYYQLGVSFRQSTVLGGKAYRRLTVDGSLPFAQAAAIGFSYNDRWQQSFISDSEDNPYLIYLSAGEHILALTVVPGEVQEVIKLLNETVSDLGELYLDITMITGETVDAYRDYDLFSQIPDMAQRLEKMSDSLESAAEQLSAIYGQKSGTHLSVIKNMARITGLMIENRYTAHRYKSEYYNCYTALASALQEMSSIPLDIDKLSLTAPGRKQPFEKKSYFSQLAFSVQKFIISFSQNYNSVSETEDNGSQITVWINWGRDQAQVFNALIQSGFTEKTGIGVNVKLASASVVQAMISGKGPDCILQQARSEPVNLAMRGALLDLRQFDDLDEVLERFQPNAAVPYMYKNGVYGLPDTQNFFMMFYRKDILDKLGLEPPETWDEFRVLIKHLARRNLTVYLPNNVATNAANVNAGVGSLNIFPTLLLQNGLSLYSEDGRSTALSSPEVMTVFQEWTDYYKKSGVLKSMDFYNRFRTGTCPLGISPYSMYTTLKAAAPEINGLWSVKQLPGTTAADGSVRHTTAGSGSACSILKVSENREEAWEFLKWWTSAETQLAYSNEIEALLGSTGRVAVSNIKALKNMSWEPEMKAEVLAAWGNVTEIPEYPGGYYVARSIYQSFWNVVNSNYTAKDVLLKYSKQADAEMAQKWSQYDETAQ